ncbi:MAG: 6-pyruvoyl-tetrahydropterin synthase-related protein [Acidobacteriota bacterium]
MEESSELTSPASIQIQRIFKRIPFNWLLVMVLLVVGTVIVAPFYFSRTAPGGNNQPVRVVPNTHDMAQHLAIMEQFDKVLRSGTLYPRWLPDVNNGYGLAWTNFYSPAFYYSTSVVNAALNNWLDSILVISVLSFLASGFAFYILARQFYGQVASATAALFYLILPYHTIDLYWRGALPELQGFILVPLITYFAYKAGSRGKLQDYAGLGLCQGIYYMTHFPVAYLMTYTIAFYGLIWAISKRDWRITFRIALGMFLALILSAIYWLPAVVESRYVQEHFTTIFPYHNSYITLLPAADRFGELINQCFAVQALALLIAIAILRFVAPRASQSISQATREFETSGQFQTRLWVIVGVATTFMVTSLSIYLSKLIPKIEAVSFAMRWMVITSFFTALVVCAAIDRLCKHRDFAIVTLWAGRIAVVLVIGLNLWITTRHIIREAVLHQPLQPPLIHYEPAFIPKGATNPRELPDTPDVLIESGSATYEILSWQPNRRELVVNAQAPVKVRLKTYNSYGWTARLDGQGVPISSDLNGIQLIEVPPGVHQLEVAFTTTPPRLIGAILFGLGLLTIIGLTVLSRRQPGQNQINAGEGIASPGVDVESPLNELSRIDAEKIHSQESVKPVASAITLNKVIIIIAIAATILLLFFLPRFFSTPENPTAPVTSEALTLGAETRLRIPRGDWVWVATTDQALNELMNALPANDTARIEMLVQSGQVLRVANHTKVRILEFDAAKTRIRILEGDHLTQEGWVPERWLGN